MTSTTAVHRSAVSAPTAAPTRRRTVRARLMGAVPPLSSRTQVVRSALVVVCVMSASLVLHLVVLSRLQHSAAQDRLFARYRYELAVGVAPTGAVDENGRELPIGTPIAYLQIPLIGVDEVVSEGTTSGVLFDGPGHRRDTPLPGQFGTSIVLGRQAAYGGPFGDIAELEAGDDVKVTTGQGTFAYKVRDVRREGDLVPPLPASGSRLTLMTAAGTSFVPNGVLRVDADLVGSPVVGQAPVRTAANLPVEERAMQGDSRSVWVLALWLQAVIGLSFLLVWAWHRWGRAQAWIVLTPPLVLVGLAASSEVVRLLPNLM